jgi:hypothetical protein
MVISTKISWEIQGAYNLTMGFHPTNRQISLMILRTLIIRGVQRSQRRLDATSDIDNPEKSKFLRDITLEWGHLEREHIKNSAI